MFSRTRFGARLATIAALAAVMLMACGAAWGQSAGDYRSAASGNWNAAATWETYDGAKWVAAVAYPTSADGIITVRNGHVVTISASGLSYDQVVVEQGGQVTVASAITHTLANGAATDLTVNGTWLNSGGTWTVTGASWTVGAGGTYIHNTTSSAATPFGVATLDPASTVIYRGSSSLTPAFSYSGRTFGNLTVESTSGAYSLSASGTSLTTVNGNFTIGSGVTITMTHTGGTTIGGNYALNGALTLSTGTQVFTFTGAGKAISGAGTIQFETLNVSAGASVTCNNAVTILSGFTATVASGATLATAAAFNNGGTMNVNGTFQIDSGGWTSGADFVYGANSTLVFNTTSLYGVAAACYWPWENAPPNVTVQNTGGISMGGDGMHTVSGLFQTAAGIYNANNLTLNNTCQINAGGWFNDAPNYGPASTLKYNTGGVYGRGYEWSAMSGAGYPINVWLTNNTVLDLGANSGTGTERQTGGDLTIDSGSALYMDYGSNDMTKTLTVVGNLQLDGSLSLSDASGGDLKLKANWTRTGTFNPKGRAVLFNGAAAQSLTGATGFDFVIMNNASGLTLASDMTVNNDLTFISGKIATGANKLVINSGGSVSSAGAGRYVFGNLQKPVNVSGGSAAQTFEIGDASVYAPVALNFPGTASASGSVVASTTAGDHPQIGTSDLDGARTVNRTWSFTNNGLGFSSYDATYNFAAGDVDGGANPANFEVRRYDGGSWYPTTPGTRTATSTQATGITSFSDFQVGEVAALSYAVAYDGNGSTGGTAPVDLGSPYLAGATVTVLGAGDLARTGYVFAGWNTAADGSGTGYAPAATFTMPAAAVTLYAQWTIGTYTLAYTAGTGGTISGTTPQTVNYGASGTTVTAVPDPGYSFTSWSDGVLTASRTDTNVTADLSVTANFALQTFTLTYTAGTGGTISGTTPQTVNYGASGTTVTAVPDPGYSFTSWSDGVLTASRTDTNVTADVTVTASFTTLPVQNTNTGLYYATIQAAIDATETVAGHAIVVGAGTFEEQVVVNKALTVTGAGCGTTVIRSPVTLTASFTTGTNVNKPIVFVNGVDATIQNLTIDGAGLGSSNYRFVGLAFWNGGGQGANLCIEHIEDTPFSGAQHGVGVYAYNSTGGPYAIELDHVTVTDFQKTGIALLGTGLTANVHDCTTTGKGYTGVTAQNGIQLSDGATGAITACKVTDIGYTGTGWAASGVLVSDAAGTVNVSNMKGANKIDNVQAPINWYTSNGTVDGVEIANSAKAEWECGIFAYNYNTSLLAGTTGTAAARERPAKASPLDGEAGSNATAGTLATSYTLDVTNSCVYGTDATNTVGLGVYSEGGGMVLNVSNSNVTDWEYGVVHYGGPATLTAHENTITSNISAGLWGDGVATTNAERNWWGDASGPSGAGSGSGDAAYDADTDPWIHSGTDLASGCEFDPPTYSIVATAGANGGISPAGTTVAYEGDDVAYAITPDAGYMVADVLVDGSSVGPVNTYTFTGVTAGHTIAASFTLAGNNVVAAVGDTLCLTPVTPCLTIPVNITRTAAADMRLFHVDFTLSPELKLCGTVGASVLEGEYLNSMNPNTTFFVLDNGGGSYTADGTINGLPCGQDAASGTLFYVKVASNGGTGTGTITVDNVVLRDCVNNDITPATPGAPAVIAFDATPVAIAEIADQTVAELAGLTVTPVGTLTECADGPLTWSISPAVPAGATFSTATGEVAWTPDCSQAGTYGPFTLTATAASGESDTEEFSILVTDTPGGVAVTVTPDPQTVAELSPLTVTPALDLTGCAAGRTPAWAADSLPGGASFDPATGVVTWTPACGQAGTYGPYTLTASVTAVGGQAYSGSATFSIAVSHLVGTVTIAEVVDQTVEEQSTLSLAPSATKTECAGTLTWSISPALPAGATFDTGTGAIGWTPPCGAQGTYGPYTLTATAATGEADTEEFGITVTHKVGTVAIAEVLDQTVEEQSTLSITPAATVTECAGTLTWSISPALPAGATFDTGTGAIAWTPACGEAGTYGPYTLTAAASTGESDTEVFGITVTHKVGTVEIAAIADQTVEELSTLTITPSATTTPCVGTLTWSISPALPAGAAFDSGTGAISWTPPCGAEGTYGPYTLTATASTGEVDTEEFGLTVTHKVGTVDIAAIADPQTVEEMSTLTLVPSATTTPCVGTLTWSVTTGTLPGGASFDPATGTITWTPGYGTAGTYGPFVLTAAAATGESDASNAFTIVVTHLAGTIEIAYIPTPQTVEELSTLTVTPSATVSPSVGPLTWSVTTGTLPAGASFDPATGEIVWTPACGEAGTYGPFALTATAATGESDVSNEFTIEVTHKVGTVTIAEVLDQTVEEQSTLSIMPSATKTECAGTLTWSISPALPAGATFSTATGEIVWTPACGEAGTYGPYTLTATASTGEADTEAFGITVTHKAGTITIAAIPTPQTVEEMSTLTVTPAATTTPCVGTLAWSVTTGTLPAGAGFDPVTGAITWTPGYGTAGTYGPFVLTATATTGESAASNAFTIEVTHLEGTVEIGPIADQTVEEKSPLTITPTVTVSPSVGPLTWSVTTGTLPAGASFDPATGVITWTPDCGQAGSYGPFVLTATATTGETDDSNPFMITVTHKVGTVSIAAIATPQTVAEMATLTITPSATLTDCAAAPLAWVVSTGTLPAWATFDAGTGAIVFAPGCTNAGSYGPFALQATAATGEVGYGNEFTVTVTDVPVAISPPTTATAEQVRLGNAPGDTTGIKIYFTQPTGAVSYKVYRAPYGHHPEYDDAGGTVPTAPAAYPPPAPWVETAVTTEGGTDTPAQRDFWYYVVYAVNGCGDVSGPSNTTGGTLNYHLGDISNGYTLGQGDNLVGDVDISGLGAHYGITLVHVADPYNFLDVGPTTSRYVDGRPLTDDKVNFEDLVMFAINYGTVTVAGMTTAPPQLAAVTPAATDALVLLSPDEVAAGQTVTVPLRMTGTGRVQALSVRLAWDATVVEPVGQAAGELLARLNGVALSPAPGTVDVAVLGEGRAVAGEGVLATVTFRALAKGDPAIRLEAVDARDTKNATVALNATREALAPALPTVTALSFAQPNPFRDEVTLSFSLAAPGPVSLRIYSVDGRLVRTLVSGTQEAGYYRPVWDGRDDHGNAMAAGVFYARLVAGRVHVTRTMSYLR